MKGKLLLASLLVGFAASAQSVVSTNNSLNARISEELANGKIENFVAPTFGKNVAQKGGQISAYYSYTDTASAFLTDLDFYALTMSPDSTTMITYSSGTTGYPYWHGLGAIYDMTFYGWGANQFAPGDQVTIDSLFVLGYYTIYDGSQQDTLRFHVFNANNNTANSGFGGVNFNAGVFSYFPTAQVPFETMDYQGGAGQQGNVGGITAANVTTIDYIFSNEDSASTVHGVAIPGGMTFNASNALGIYVEYIPGGYGPSDNINYQTETGTTNPFSFLAAGEPDLQNERGDFVAFYDSTYMNTGNFALNENRYEMFTNAPFLNTMLYPYAALANFIIVHASGTSTIGLEEGLVAEAKVFPNPSNGIFNVQLNANATATVKVVDILGQVVYASTENFVAGQRKAIDLSNQAKGMYILTIEGEGVNAVERLTIK